MRVSDVCYTNLQISKMDLEVVREVEDVQHLIKSLNKCEKVHHGDCQAFCIPPLPVNVIEQIIEEMLLTLKNGQRLLAGQENYREHNSLVNWSVCDHTYLGNRYKRTFKLRRPAKALLDGLAGINHQFQKCVEHYLFNPLTITTLADIPHDKPSCWVRHVEVQLIERLQRRGWPLLVEMFERSKKSLQSLVLDIAPPEDAEAALLLPMRLWNTILQAEGMRRFAFRAHVGERPAFLNSSLLKLMLDTWTEMEDLEVHYFQGTLASENSIYDQTQPRCSLRSLFLRNPQTLHKRDIEYIVATSHLSLVELTIMIHQPDEETFQALIDGLKECQAITTLRLAVYHPPRMKVAWHELESEDDYFEELKRLNPPSRAPQRFLCEMLKQLPELEHLQLAGGVWTNGILRILAPSVALKSLCLQNIDDFDFECLHGYLRSSENMAYLKELVVSRCSDPDMDPTQVRDISVLCEERNVSFRIQEVTPIAQNVDFEGPLANLQEA